MTVVLDVLLGVHYGFAHLSTEHEPDLPGDPDLMYAGQRNGLCGAAVPHILAMVIGTHTGEVGFRIEWHDSVPPIGDEWHDVVEVSLDVRATDAQLSAFDEFVDVVLPRSGPHRVRYCAFGMDAARDAEDDVDEEPGDDDPPAPDRYLLQLWPAPAEADSIVRESSAIARYWHDAYGGTPALSAEQIAQRRAAERAEHLEGDYPDGMSVVQPSTYDEQVEGIHRLVGLSAARRRSAARLLARLTVQQAGLAGHPAFVAALRALDAGAALPAPFDDLDAALVMPWLDDTSDDAATAGFGWYGDDHPSRPSHLAMLAVSAVDAASDPDELRGVVAAYRCACASLDHDHDHDLSMIDELGLWEDGSATP